MFPVSKRTAATCMLFCLAVAGSQAGLPAPKSLPAPAAAAQAGKRARRPWLLKFRQLVAQNNGNVARVKTALANMRVDPLVKNICFVSANRNVACLSVSELLENEIAHAADRSLIQMALNDLLDAVGAPAGADVLTLCGNSTDAAVTHLLPISVPSGLGGGGFLGGARGVSTRGKSTGAWTLPAGRAAAFTTACNNAQYSSLRAGLGGSVPGDIGYERARDAAKSAMDAAVSQCRDSGSILPTRPGGGVASDPTGGDTANNSDNSNTGNTGADTSGDSDSQSREGGGQQNAVEAFVNVVNLSLGAAETLIERFGPSMGTGGRPSPAKLAVGLVGAVAGAVGLGGNETADTVGNVTDVVDAVMTLGEAAGAAGQGATAVGAVGAEAALFPVVASFFGGYAATRLTNTLAGGAVDRAAVGAYGVLVSDPVWQFDKATSSGNSPKRSLPPGSEGGKTSCRGIAGSWEMFVKYCSQPGNNWTTYDCALFVARMNGCADPALINPGPNGDYVCAARCSRSKGSARYAFGSAGGEASGAECQERRLLAECAEEERRKGIESRWADGDDRGRPGCKERVADVLNLQQHLKALVLQNICQKASAGDNELCGGPRSRRPGQGNAVRRQ